MYRFFVFFFCVFFSIQLPAEKIELSGNWGVKLDSQAIGINENWQKCEYKDSINLPGALHTGDYGFDITPHTKWYSGNLSALWHYHPMYEKYRKPGNIKIFDFLQPKKQYIGVAWYKRTFDLPVDQNRKEYFIYLERVHWESTLYINNKKIGSNRGLGTAHEYNITDFVKSGKNEIVLRIDNSSVVDLGRIPHSISEQTMAAWNGIIGDMEIRTKDKIWIDQLQVFPNFEKKQAVLKLKIANRLNKSEKLILHLEVKNYNSQHTFPEKHLAINCTVHADSVTPIEIVYPFSKNVQSWNEFNPSLYKINVSLKSANANDHISESFGFRDLSLNGRRFALNGRTISVRGNINCGEFPVDGLPEMSVEWWKNIFNIHKEWGHNMVRFHSWCPPKAAFIAADEVGIYLQPEVSEWAVIVTPEQEQFIAEENDRMIAQYGNHPSWLFIAMGNELRSDPKIMERFITKNKSDQRRFVSGKTNGRPLLDSFDFASSYGINGQRVRHHMGWPPLPETNLLFHIQPNTAYDYSEAVKEYPKPFLAHEIGQYCVFPDYEHELPKYTGSLRATVLDIQKDQLEERGMANQSGLFSEATGKWQIELLKSEYEANLRTKEMGGFHALSLQDFPGQSHAPVGVLDMFWEAKNHITSEVFRQFCDETVLLARIPALILQQKDTFQAAVELYNFAEEPLYRKQVSYTITDEKNNIIMKGIFKKKDFANQQSNIPVGTIALKLQEMKAPAKYSLKLKMDKTTIENKYNFWVYPDNIPFDNGTVKVVRDFDEQTIQYLENGHNVLWLTDQSKLKGDLPTSFASIYWTAFGLNDGESMTNSILCDPGHPLFRNFPTDMHSNWQWWDILRYSVPMILDEFGAKAAFPKSYKPVLQAIDSWKVNRKLALLAECRYAKGKLMISGIDFSKDMEKRVASQQLYCSLIGYMSSNDFNPQTLLDKATILSVYGVPENNLLNIGAKVITTNKLNNSRDSQLFDGDKKTVWKAEGTKGSITIDLKNIVQIKGLTLMLPEKGIHQYTYYMSDDDVNWELVSNSPSQPDGDKQIILFNKSVSKRYIRINFDGFIPSVSELDLIYADALPVEG